MGLVYTVITSIKGRHQQLLHHTILRVAANWERSVTSAIVFRKCKGFEKSQFYKISKELRCGDLVLKQTFQLLDQSSTYTAPPICFLVSSSNDFTRWSPSVPQKWQTSLDSSLGIWYSHPFAPVLTKPSIHRSLTEQKSSVKTYPLLFYDNIVEQSGPEV